MSETRWNFWVNTVAVVLMVASCFTGVLAPFAIIALLGAAAIQAGIHGFLRTGYSFGTYRVTGWPARWLGGIAIALGAGLIAAYLFVVIFAVDWKLLR